ncbi:MAG: hypothetical protein JSR93_10005 [Verrucomicrobia bacterium]|nr:hypothetical protein [Verrucomicrobiota bacterium]
MASTSSSTSFHSAAALPMISVSPILSSLHAFLDGTNPLSGSELIALLKQDPKLSELYSLSAGVGEGYSIEEHIHMVVDSFAKEFVGQPEVQTILDRSHLSPQQFLLFLALHDIGKGRAVQEIRSATPARKELELKYTQEEVRRVCKEWNLEALIPVFEALLEDDSIGDLMKTRQPTDADFQKTAQSIDAGARISSLPTEAFLDLKILFHKVDAASYEFVRVRFFKHHQNERVTLGKESLPKYIGYSDANEAKAAQLKSALGVSTQSSATSSEEPKLTDSEFLSLFKESVWDYSNDEILNLEGALKYVRRTEGKESDRYLQLKERVMQLRMARLPLRAYEMWKSGSWELKSNSFAYNSPKDKQVRKMVKHNLIAQVSSTHIEKRLKLISRLTFIHGSSSAALAMMLLSPEPSLLWTGALLAAGIAPMYGELDRGVDPWGVNQKGLSTETVRNIGRILNYTKMNPFNPQKFAALQNPYHLLDLSQDSFYHFVCSLKRWKDESPNEYAAVLAPGTRKASLLIDAIIYKVAQLEKACSDYEKAIIEKPHAAEWYSITLKEYRERLPLLQTLSAQLANGEDLTIATESDPYYTFPLSDYKFQKNVAKIREPYSLLSEEDGWSRKAVQIIQMKQWEPPLFQQIVLPNRNEWLISLEKERAQQEKPLKQLLAIIDHTFTEEEIAFISNQRDGSSSRNSNKVEMPSSLQDVFANPSDIPKKSRCGINFGVDAVYREISHYREGNYQWSALIDTMLSSRLYGSNMDEYKPVFEEELERIERGFNHIAAALSDAPAVIEIPQDEAVRSLITQPVPIIFSSSTIRPKPIAAGPNPSEYALDTPTKLGKDGSDILFTDTHESRERIRAVLPEHLQKEIEIHLFEELDVSGVPLIHAPHQITSI